MTEILVINEQFFYLLLLKVIFKKFRILEDDMGENMN